jgi:hypothetical protein
MPPGELDEQLLKTWNERLLYGCHDLRQWAPVYAKARERQQVIDRMKQAIQDSDVQSVETLRNEPCLRGYPLPPDLAAAIQDLYHQIERSIQARRQALTGALLENDKDQFAAKFDRTLVHEICEKHQHHQKLAAAWTESEVLSLARSGLARDEESGLEQVESDEFKIRWVWPSRRITETCCLVVCRERPKPFAEPGSVTSLYAVELSRSQWEAADRCHPLKMQADWENCYVYVWPVVDLGFQVFYGEPLEIGQLRTHARRHRWSLFG